MTLELTQPTSAARSSRASANTTPTRRGLCRIRPGRDWILTRILWLSGCEPGFNRLGKVDTMRRLVYIHGTPDSEPLGESP